MKTHKLLVSAVLALAIGVPAAGLVGDITMSQPTIPEGVRVPFLHGFFNTLTSGQSELASLATSTHRVLSQAR
jgi:hypothetical protein